MSAGVNPARSKAIFPERTQGDSVKSGHSLMVVCDTASPVPNTQMGSVAQSLARSSLVSTMAPPPSERMQQCSLVSGSHTMPEFMTSSMVMRSW